MNSKIKAVAFTMLVATFGFQGVANAATATGTASATILSPVTVTKADDLNFGKIIAGASDATVTLTSAGAFTCGSGLTCAGSHSAALFNVAGTSGEVVTVSSDATTTLTSGSNTMTASLSPSASTLTLAGGAAQFNVGGALTVAGGQAAGSYSGDFNVTVNYQ